MRNNRFDRQADIISQEQLNIPITIVGAGGIGSWTALALAKMGCQRIKIYDFDTVENHNVASQFFKPSQLNLLKIKALEKSIKEQTGIKIFTYNQNIEEVDIPEKELLIITLDTMEGRAKIAEKYKEKNIYIIDGRMGGLQMEIYNMPASNYPKTIVPIEDVEHDICTARAIAFNCMFIAGLIGNLVRQYIRKEIEPGSLIYLFESNSLLKKKYD